jgi:plastocyanin
MGVSIVTRDVIRVVSERVRANRGGRRVLLAGALMLGVAGCGSDSMGFEPVLSSHEFFSGFTLSARAVNLATDPAHNTLQLQVVPRFTDGSVVPGTVTFTSNNPVITVGATGLVTATGATAVPAIVSVSMTYNGLTRKDSLLVAAIAGAPAAPIQSLSIQPVPGDSAKVGAAGSIYNGSDTLHVLVRDANGDSVPNLAIDYSSSDSLTAKFVAPGVLVGRRPDTVTVYATTYAYGVTKTDSLRYTIGNAISAIVSVVKRTPTGKKDPIMTFDPGTVTVGTGGTITWNNQTPQLADIVFDDSLAVSAPDLPGFYAFFLNGYPGSGNIPPMGTHYDATGQVIVNSLFASRTFHVAGTYTYHSPMYGTRGAIVVCDERLSLCLP